MPSFITTIDLYERPNFDLEPEDTVALALVAARWARGVYQPEAQFAGYSHQVYISYVDDDGNQTVIRRWQWTSKNTKGNGYWELTEIRGVPDSE